MLIIFDNRARPSAEPEILVVKLGGLRKKSKIFATKLTISNLINIEHYRSFRKTERTEEESMETDSCVADIEGEASTRKDKGTIFSSMCFNQ